MKYVAVKDLSSKWKISERRIRKMCEEGLIQGANKVNGSWMIPSNTTMPKDRRYKDRKNIVIVSSSLPSATLIAREFKIKGCNPIIITNQKSNDSTINSYYCNIENEDELKVTLDKIEKIDCLVIFPSSYLPKSIIDTTEEEFERFSNLIVKMAYNTIKHSISKIRKRKGNILLIHSSVSINAEPAAPLYCMLQATLIMLGKALALREGQFHVRVNNLVVGPATTDQLMSTISNNQIKKWKKINPLGVSFKFEDFLNAISFVCLDNPSSKKMTGCVMSIDGGESIADAYTITQKEGL